MVGYGFGIFENLGYGVSKRLVNSTNVFEQLFNIMLNNSFKIKPKVRNLG